DQIFLLNREGDTIENLVYKASWYGSQQFSGGGYSLEKRDLSNPCVADSINYRASSKIGSPGFRNFLYENIRDTTPPEIVQINFPDSMRIRITLSEAMDPKKVFAWLDQVPLVVSLENSTQLLLHTGKPLINNAFQQHVLVLSGLEDCAGNIGQDSFFFVYTIPVAPSPFDLVFSEVLFYSKGLQPEFVELYNRSQKAIDLSGIQFYLNGHPFLLPSFALFPGKAVVLAEDSIPGLSSSAQLILKGWKKMDNREGKLLLSNWAGAVIDACAYS